MVSGLRELLESAAAVGRSAGGGQDLVTVLDGALSLHDTSLSALSVKEPERAYIIQRFANVLIAVPQLVTRPSASAASPVLTLRQDGQGALKAFPSQPQAEHDQITRDPWSWAN